MDDLFRVGQQQALASLQETALGERLHPQRLRTTLMAGLLAGSIALGAAGQAKAEGGAEVTADASNVVTMLTKRAPAAAMDADTILKETSKSLLFEQVKPRPDRYSEVMLEVMARAGVELPVAAAARKVSDPDFDFEVKWHGHAMTYQVEHIRHTASIYNARARDYQTLEQGWFVKAQDKANAAVSLAQAEQGVQRAVKDFFDEYKKTLQAGYASKAWDLEAAAITRELTPMPALDGLQTRKAPRP
jgi:hypothetical protein